MASLRFGGWLVVGWISVSLASCSFVGLEDLEIRPCLLEGETDFAAGNELCRTLEDGEPDDPCNVWVCRSQVGNERFCVQGAPDADNDGVGDAMCLGLGEGGDCDDSDPTVRSDAPEICDGKDNDCDSNIDEGVLRVGAPTVAGTFTVDRPSGGATLSYGSNDTRLSVVYDHEITVGMGLATVVHVWRPGMSAGAPVELEGGTPLLRRDNGEFSIEPVDGELSALAVTPTGLNRIAVGVVDDDNVFRTDSDHFTDGVPSTTGGICPGECQLGRDLSMAATSDEYLLSYIGTASTPGCGAGATGPWQLAGGDVQRASGAMPSTEPSLDAGTVSNALAGTAALSLSRGRFATAAFSASDEMTVQLVTGDPDSLEMGTPITLALGGDGEELNLIAGEVTEAGQEFFAAMLVGCEEKVATIQRFIDDGTSLQAVGELVSVADGAPHTGLSVVWSEQPRGLMLVWVQGRNVMAQLVSETGERAGDPLTVVDIDAAQGAFAYGAQVLPRSEGGFVVYAYSDGSMGGPAGMREVPIICGGE